MQNKRHKTLSVSFVLFLLLQPAILHAEIKQIGTPPITNFSKQDYQAGGQNWAIIQDQQGFIYSANSEGVLIYDGNESSLFHLPNSSTPRSLTIDKSGEIYVGAYNDFGKLAYDADGRMFFHSFRSLIPEQYQNFDDIWRILTFNESIIFQSYQYAYILKPDSTISILETPERFNFAFKVYDKIYFNDLKKGLLEYDGQQLTPLKGCESLIGEEIRSLEPYYAGKQLLIGTQNKGLFLYNGQELKPWNIEINNELKTNQIFCSTMLSDGYYAIGTIQQGVYIIDNLGNKIQHINRSNGLGNNTILSVFADRNQNIWLGLDNGIGYLQVNSPITYINEGESIGAGYTSIIHNNRVYLGTNQGLFVKQWMGGASSEPFKLVENTSGQVWNLAVFDNQLLCGHNKGTFVIENERATLIDKTPGVWKFHRLKRFPENLIAGTYSGLILFRKEGARWVFDRRISGFNESFRVFEEDNQGNLWMSHGFKGIYKIELGARLDTIKSFRYFTTKDGLPSNYNLTITKLGKQLIVASYDGLYEYSEEQKKFLPSIFWNDKLEPVKHFNLLKEDRFGNIWFIDRKFQLGIFRSSDDGSYKLDTKTFELLNGKFISGFSDIYALNKDQYIITIDAGFAHFTPQINRPTHNDFNAYIRRAEATYLDSAFYLGHHPEKSKTTPHYSFPFAKNAFKFWFTTPIFEDGGKVKFSYLLDGYTDEWSNWSTAPIAEFTNLPEGEYRFRVKAKNMSGHESIEDEITFHVRPPWFRSGFAYVIYMGIFLSIIFLGIYLIMRRMEISKRKERLKHLKSYRQKEQEYKRQALLSEKKIVSLKNEKLRTEMIHRDKELANKTMDLIRKNKFLGKIKDDLQKLNDAIPDKTGKEKIASLVKRIDKDIDSEKQWEVFESAFDEVHEDFLQRLKSKYPQLTPKELRLCAYLRMNISTKEIAPLMNISVRGVEICRYRVRKKLEIDRDTNLTRLIMEL